MSACIACGSEFQCGMVDAGSHHPCWCTRLPPVSAALLETASQRGDAGCYCPDCLRAIVNGQQPGSGTVA